MIPYFLGCFHWPDATVESKSMCQCHAMIFHQLGPHDWRSRTGKLIETAKRLIKWETSLSTAAYKISKCTDFSSCGYRCVMSSRWSAMKNSAPDIIISPKHQQFLSRERFPGFPSIHPPWTIEIPQGIHQFLDRQKWLPFGPAAKVCYHDPSQAQGTKPWYKESISHFAPSCCCDASNMETYKHDAYLAHIMHHQGCFKTFQGKSGDI